MKKVCLIILILLAVKTSKAELLTLTVPVAVKFEPTKVSGMIIDNDKTIFFDKATFTRHDLDYIKVNFHYDDRNFSNKAMASAIVEGKNEKIAFGNVINTKQISSEVARFKMPTCETKEPPASLESRLSLIENLVRVRSDLSSNRKELLKKLLTKDTIQKLMKLENGFGYETSKELNISLDPNEIVERLSRIANSLKKYRIYKQQQEYAK